MNNIRIRFAEQDDADEIVQLFCRGLAPDIVHRLIYACSGAANYIRMQIVPNAAGRASAYFVAEVGPRRVGAAELRRTPGNLFLNFIGVDPDQQGAGIGTRLLASAIRMSEVSSGRIGLDVDDDNVRARRWYERLGFQVLQARELIEVSPFTPSADEPTYISELPQADVCHGNFGFSKFQLSTMLGTYSIGRIGDAWFRIDDCECLADSAALNALRTLDSTRRIIGFLTKPPTAVIRVIQILSRFRRMEADISQVIASLERTSNPTNVLKAP